MSRFFHSCAVAAALWLLLLPSNAQSVLADLGPDGAEIFDTGGEVHLNIALTRPVPWRVRLEDSPPRLIVEFNELVWNRDPKVQSTSIANVTVGRSGPGVSELVAILREPLGVATAEMKSTSDGAILKLRLQPSTAAMFRADVDAAPEPGTETRPVVAIDPGHGGIDPGAEAGDLDEADLVLTFAQRLQEELVSTGQFEVVLTRQEDKFVSLDERLTLARGADADMFLSIHADALDSDDASGMVVYSLGPSGQRNAAQRLTERHGGDDLLRGVDLSGAGDDVKHALIDLARQDTTPRTQALSRALVEAFEASGLALNSRPERTGQFAVLKAADIPSVLVELGFLSTEGDLNRLTSDAWQVEASQAIRDALVLWHDEDSLR